MPVSNPRRAAAMLLHRVVREGAFADLLIDRELRTGFVRGPDRALFTELVYGVLRRQGTLDHIICQFSRQPLAKLEPFVVVLLRLGLYQMFFLDRVPVAAAVNETVSLAGEMIPRARGFVNAVLRSADRGRDAIGYPDRDRDPAGFISARHSHPRWLVEQWMGQLGSEEAETLAEAMSGQPPLTARVNALKLSRDQLLQRLADEGIDAAPCCYSPYGLRLDSAGPLDQLSSFRKGLFSIQDESSQLACLLVGPLPGERVLDLCAAPGGKATALAEFMGNRGEVAACDVSDGKLGRVADAAARLGITIVTTHLLHARQPPSGFRGSFHRVLVDAPCSAVGVIRRNPEIKWRRSPADLERLAENQRTILAAAAGCVAPGGVLLYATCSTTREENEAVVDDFLSRESGFVLEDGREVLPRFPELFTERGMFRSWPHRHDGMDGFCAARLRRVAS